MMKASGPTEIMGSCHCGEEDIELARSCGAEGSKALGPVTLGSQTLGSQTLGSQTLGSQTLGEQALSVLGRVLPGIPHEDYRVLVMATALNRNPRPTTKDFAIAKARVDRMLVHKGIGISIPAARPGRVTL